MVFFIEIWKCWLVYGEAIYYLNILDSITLQPSYTLIRITECLLKFYMANRTLYWILHANTNLSDPHSLLKIRSPSVNVLSNIMTYYSHKNANRQKQPVRGVLRNRCSENIQQIYRRTPLLKCDFTKVALQLYWKHLLARVFSCKFAAYFQNTFCILDFGCWKS